MYNSGYTFSLSVMYLDLRMFRNLSFVKQVKTCTFLAMNATFTAVTMTLRLSSLIEDLLKAFICGNKIL